MAIPPSKLPTFFLSHGGGPAFFMEGLHGPFQHMDKNSRAAQWYRDFAATQGLLGAGRPSSILIISAHWYVCSLSLSVVLSFVVDLETLTVDARDVSPICVQSGLSPPLLFDYYGFPDFTYQLTYPALGSPELSRRGCFHFQINLLHRKSHHPPS